VDFVKPNHLRYAQCELPTNIEALLNAFTDEFYTDMSIISNNLDNAEKNIIPGLLIALKEQVDIRNQLIKGAPVKELASLQAFQDNLRLTNPELDENDPSVVSLDERKLLAAGIVLLNGKMFASTVGNDLEAFRQLWFATNGNYEAFLALGDGIADNVDGAFTLVQYLTNGKFPYLNFSFNKLDTYLENIKLSKYKQSVIWVNKIGVNTSNGNKLKDIGFDDTNISRIFSRGQPRDADIVLEGYLTESVAQVKSFTELCLLPLSNEKRKPRYQNEVKFLTVGLKSYLKYRQNKNLSSYVFNTNYWELVKAHFNSNDMKELFENRPEVKNISLPVDDYIIGDLLNEAGKLPLYSSAIHSFLISLSQTTFDGDYERQLIALTDSFLTELNATEKGQAFKAGIDQLFLELKGNDTIKKRTRIAELPGAFIRTDQKATAGEITSAINDEILNSPNPELAKIGVDTGNIGDQAINTKNKPTNGFQTAENYMTNLFRRVEWKQNFSKCSKSEKNTNNFSKLEAEAQNTDKFKKYKDIKDSKTGSTADSNIAYNQDITKASQAGQSRRYIEQQQAAQPTQVSGKFQYQCTPYVSTEFTRLIEQSLADLSKDVITACEFLKRGILLVQDIVDTLIAKAQSVLNKVLGVLERLLTLDFNIGGALGFDTSVIKCSWSLDFGLKIDLFGLLLQKLNEFFKTWGLPIKEILVNIQDIIAKAICVPVRLIESFAGGVNSLLNLIGCSVKDVQLPDAFINLLNSILFTFDLRTLVLRSGYQSFLQLSANFSKNKDAYRGLTQFASLCQKNSMKDVVDGIDNVLLKAAVMGPFKAADAIGKSAEVLTKQALSKTIGVAI